MEAFYIMLLSIIIIQLGLVGFIIINNSVEIIELLRKIAKEKKDSND